jgi:hypothetical protein
MCSASSVPFLEQDSRKHPFPDINVGYLAINYQGSDYGKSLLDIIK